MSDSPYEPHSPEGTKVPLSRWQAAARDRRCVDLESSMVIEGLSGWLHDIDELRMRVHEAQVQHAALGATLQALARALDKHSPKEK